MTYQRVISKNLIPTFQLLLCQRFGRQLAATVTTFPLKDEHLFTNEHYEMRQSLKKLIDKDINPYVDEWEKQEIFPAHQVFKNLGDNGFLGVNYSTEYGGLDLPYSFNIAIAEELGNIHCVGVPMAIGVQTDMATPALATFGSDELRKKFLTPTIAGDMVACVGVSEAGAGSDVASIQTTAVPKRGMDDYIINGNKMWTTSGLQADWMCLLANTSEGNPHTNKSLICLPMDASGISKTKIHKLGAHSSDTAQMFFDNVVVPKKYLIGEEGKGFTYQMIQFQRERLWCAASGIKLTLVIVGCTVIIITGKYISISDLQSRATLACCIV